MRLKNKRISERINRIKEMINQNKRLFLIVVIGIAGMLIILLSELFESDDDNAPTLPSSQIQTVTGDTYKQKTEKELLKIISKIDGVGTADLLVTVDGTTEYIYAEELDTSNDKSDEEQREGYNNKIVLIDENGVQKPLIKKIIEPKVTGVLIVCSGGDRFEIIDKVQKAVSTALNIPASSVCVVKG